MKTVKIVLKWILISIVALVAIGTGVGMYNNRSISYSDVQAAHGANEFVLYGRENGTSCDDYTKGHVGMVILCEHMSPENSKAIWNFNVGQEAGVKEGTVSVAQNKDNIASLSKSISGCFKKGGNHSQLVDCVEINTGLKEDPNKPKAAPVQHVQQQEHYVDRWLREMHSLGGRCNQHANYIAKLAHSYGKDSPMVTRAFDSAADDNCF